MSKRWRIGPIDVAVAALVLVVMFLPERALQVSSAYPEVDTDAIARAQARLAVAPGDGEAAEMLVDALLRTQHSDWAQLVAQQAASHRDSKTRWRSLSALANTHLRRSNRLGAAELTHALTHAKAAVRECQSNESHCDRYDLARLNAELAWTRRAVTCPDPRTSQGEFNQCAGRPLPFARFRF